MSAAVACDPVFILAAPHSGAARLTAMLGRHRQVCALPELNLFVADRVDELLEIDALTQGLTLDGLLRAVAELECRGQSDATITQARAWLRGRNGESVGRLLAHLQDRAGAKVLAVPDWQSALRPMDLLRLDRYAPQARIVHLTRHPYTHGLLFAESLRERLFVAPDFKDHSQKLPRIDPQIPWLRANRNLCAWGELQADPRRYLRVGIEAFEDPSPEPALARLCDWLGLSRSAEDYAGMRDYPSWPFWAHGPRSAPCGLEIEAYESPSRKLAGAARDDARLDAALPWRNGEGFAPEVRELATAVGYA